MPERDYHERFDKPESRKSTGPSDMKNLPEPQGEDVKVLKEPVAASGERAEVGMGRRAIPRRQVNVHVDPVTQHLILKLDLGGQEEFLGLKLADRAAAIDAAMLDLKDAIGRVISLG